MKLWLAGTDPDLASESFSLGLFVGVLTNPPLLAAAKCPPLEVIGALCAAVPGPVFHQLRDDSVVAMKAEAARWLDRGWNNLGLKVALSSAGCAVLHWLREQRVEHRLATCAPTVTQVLLATALDVPWLTPSGSALERLGGPAKVDVVAEMQAVLDRQHASTRLIPSLNSTSEMHHFARAGVTHGFVWQRDVARFTDHELVASGIAAFARDWAEIDRIVAATGN